MPYGTKSPATVVRYSLEAAAHLMSRDIRMLVVACNTATTDAEERFRRIAGEFLERDIELLEFVSL